MELEYSYLHFLIASDRHLRRHMFFLTRVFVSISRTHFLNPRFTEFFLIRLFPRYGGCPKHFLWKFNAIATACLCGFPDLINSRMFRPTFFCPQKRGILSHSVFTYIFGKFTWVITRWCSFVTFDHFSEQR
jgi:hypothetical protein